MPSEVRDRHQRGLARYRENGHGPVLDSGHPVKVPTLPKSGVEFIVELSLSPSMSPPATIAMWLLWSET